jgi:hypothetical protein
LIILGVAAGNFISSWITAKYIEADIETASVKISKTPSTQAKKSQQAIKKHPKSDIAKNTPDQEQLSEQRKLDDNGIRFTKTCSEWTVAHKDMQTQTSERGMENTAGSIKTTLDQDHYLIRTNLLDE